MVVGDLAFSVELKDGAILRRLLDRIRHRNAKPVVGSHELDGEPIGNQQPILLLRDAACAQAFTLAKPKLSLDALAAKFGRSPERFKRLIRLS